MKQKKIGIGGTPILKKAFIETLKLNGWKPMGDNTDLCEMNDTEVISNHGNKVYYIAETADIIYNLPNDWDVAMNEFNRKFIITEFYHIHTRKCAYLQPGGTYRCITDKISYFSESSLLDNSKWIIRAAKAYPNGENISIGDWIKPSKHRIAKVKSIYSKNDSLEIETDIFNTQIEIAQKAGSTDIGTYDYNNKPIYIGGKYYAINTAIIVDNIGKYIWDGNYKHGKSMILFADIDDAKLYTIQQKSIITEDGGILHEGDKCYLLQYFDLFKRWMYFIAWENLFMLNECEIISINEHQYVVKNQDETITVNRKDGAFKLFSDRLNAKAWRILNNQNQKENIIPVYLSEMQIDKLTKLLDNIE